VPPRLQLELGDGASALDHIEAPQEGTSHVGYDPHGPGPDLRGGADGGDAVFEEDVESSSCDGDW